jgi:hypothetical protein
MAKLSRVQRAFAGASALARKHPRALALAIAAGGIWLARAGGWLAGLEAGLLLGAFLIFAFDWTLLRPAISAALAISLGLLPQTIFLVAYNTGFTRAQLAGSDAVIEPALSGALGRYEHAAVWLHQAVDRLDVPPWLAFVLAAAAPLILAGPMAEQAAKWFGRYADAVSKALLVLLAASSFTLLAPAPSGRWTPNLPARIGALKRVEIKARADMEASRQLIAAAGDDALLKSLTEVVKALERPAGCAQVPKVLRLHGCTPEQAAAYFERDYPHVSSSERARAAREAAVTHGKALVDQVLPPASPPPEPPSAAPAAATLDQVRAKAAQVLKVAEYAQRLREKAAEIVADKVPLTGQEIADEVLRPVLTHLLDRLGEFVLRLMIAYAARHGGQPVLDADVRTQGAAMLHAVLGRTASPDDAAPEFRGGMAAAEQDHDDWLRRLLKWRIADQSREPGADHPK